MSLEICDVSVTIDEIEILPPVSFNVPTGTTMAVIGPSGAGKSTLLRVIAGIMDPTTGTIMVDEREVTEVPAFRRNIGMVFQDNQLFPHLDVAQNIAFGLRNGQGFIRHRRENRVRVHSRVTEMLELVGLTGFEQRTPFTLSGGETKRVALARALAMQPTVLLLDEPLTGLDRELHDRLMHDLARILEITRTTAVLVTHDESEAHGLSANVTRLPRL